MSLLSVDMYMYLLICFCNTSQLMTSVKSVEPVQEPRVGLSAYYVVCRKPENYRETPVIFWTFPQQQHGALRGDRTLASGVRDRQLDHLVHEGRLVGQAGVEPAEGLPGGFTVRAASRYGILAHVAAADGIEPSSPGSKPGTRPTCCTAKCGAPSGVRTRDLRLKGPLLYQLSYWRRWRLLLDSNQRPSG